MKAKLLVIVLVLSGSFVTVNDGYACGSNQPPVAILTAEPSVVLLGDSVLLDGSTSYDPDGDIVKYEWDWTNNDSYDYSEESPCDGKTTHTYGSYGTYTAKLRVTDDDSATDDTGTCTVYVYRVKNITQSTLYQTIQAAINDANDGDEIVAYSDTYYENVDFSGVNCTVRSTDPNDPDVVAATIIDANSSGNAVTFESSEGANAVLTGFTITHRRDLRRRLQQCISDNNQVCP